MHRVSCPHTPQQNGLVERKHRHIVEVGLSLMVEAGLPSKFWDDAFLTAVYLINLLPSKTINNIPPFEKLNNTKPVILPLRVFGSLCYPFMRPYNKNKLQYRSVPATFLGYSPSHKGYKALLPQGKVIITRDIVFDESSFPFKSVSFSHTAPPPTSPTFPVVIPPPMYSSEIPMSTNYIPQTTHTSDSISQVGAEASISPQSPNFPQTSNPTPENISCDPPTKSSSPIVIASPDNSSSTALTDPAPPAHPMITRARVGIFKPKLFTLVLSASTLPKYVLEALLIPICKEATLLEFLALLKTHMDSDHSSAGKESYRLHLGIQT